MHRLLALLLSWPASAGVPARHLALARNVELLEASPDARRAYFVSDITGAPELWSVPSAGGWPSQLTENAGVISASEVSPDGSSLAYAADRGDGRADLFLVSARGGPAENLTRSPQSESSPRFSPDGARLAYLSDPAAPGVLQLVVRDLAAGSARALTRGGESVRAPAWSPDGRRLAALRGFDVLVLDAAGKKELVHARRPEDGRPLSVQWSPDGRALLILTETGAGRRGLTLLSSRTGRSRPAGPQDWDIRKAAWRGSSGILLARRDGGSAALYRLERPGAAPRRVSSSAENVEDFALDPQGEAALVVYREGAKSFLISRVLVEEAARAQR